MARKNVCLFPDINPQIFKRSELFLKGAYFLSTTNSEPDTYFIGWEGRASEVQ